MTKIDTVRMVALQPFSGAEGDVKPKDEINVIELRARQLEESGVARRLPPKEPEHPAEPTHKGPKRH